MITVRVPATTANLGPGFDCMGMALDLHCYVSIGLKASGIDVCTEGQGADVLPRDHTSIVVRAAATVFERAGLDLPGLTVRVENSIPIARGLGSSAAAIVGGLVAANCLIGGRFSVAELLGMGAALDSHADNVAAALLGGVAIVGTSDGSVLCHRLEPPQGISIVAAVPDFALPTAEARLVLPDVVPMGDAVFNLSRVALVTAALQSGDVDLLACSVEDRLHQQYRGRLIPGMEDVFAAAKAAGALAAAVSGSGSTLIAFCRDAEGMIGSSMAMAFGRHGVNCSILTMRPQAAGAEIVR